MTAETTFNRNWAGHRFVTRDGKRTVVIVREVSEFRGERMFRIRTINYPERPDLIGRESTISASGLTRTYVPIEMED